MIKEFTVKCKNCGKEFTVFEDEYKFPIKGDKYFCCRSCANTRHHSKETKEKISKTLTKKPLIRYCAFCGNKYKPTSLSKFCSIECKIKYRKEHYTNLSEEARKKLSNAGKHSVLVQAETRRSKNEILFYELCKKRFGNVEHNKPIFNNWDADVIIHDIKYAVLWNGAWHYKKIKKSHSVKEVQNRDNIKINEIKKFGYTPYIIKDMGKYNKKFVQDKFDEFLEYISKSN